MQLTPLRLIALLVSTALFFVSCGATARNDLHVNSAIDSDLRQIRAIDNHAHPKRVTAAGEEDHDYDALPVEIISDPALPAPARDDSHFFTNPYPETTRAVFGPGGSRARRDAMASKGDNYPAFVLNQVRTDVMLANRVAMGRGLASDRFKWVPFVDMFLFPLNNAGIQPADQEHAAFFQAESRLLKRFLEAAHVQVLPADFDDYLTFVGHTLESWKASGAVAVKFELAYLRDLDISNPPRDLAERVYENFSRLTANNAAPGPDEYKLLQDFLFRYIAGEAGRLNLPVHIHTSIGAGSYFRAANANPLALEPLFNDPALRRTKFVMLHGAWPFTRQAAALILKPNVYVDFSAFAYLTFPRQSASDLRIFLESAPEKVLYASDASPLSTEIGWEETAWLGSQRGRLALSLALTDMAADGEITVDQAKAMGRAVLRGNAHQLYGF